MANSQDTTPLLDALRQCSQKDQAAFYTPGHKRGQGISSGLKDWLGSSMFQADLPELPELDNLFAPQGVIQAAQALAAAAFGAEQTWFLANGSTSGVIAAILATCNPGEKIVLPRNVHYSVISGLILVGAVPVFLQPEYDPGFAITHSITPAAVAIALATHPDAKAVMMVCPTYYGVCGDVAAIAQLCHQHQIPLLVDEAHGAHFAFHPELPSTALAAGADLAVQSTHKTLSALTQAAMVHVQGRRINRDRLTRSLAIVQSTSPNYLLLASLDAARHQMATQGQALMARTLELADWARQAINPMPGLSTLDPDHAQTPGFVALDRTRLTVMLSALGLDGFTADALLHQQANVTCELPSLHHLTFIISLGNTRADVERLLAGLQLFSDRAQSSAPAQVVQWLQSPLPTPYPSAPLTPREAFFAPLETVPVEQAIDRISGELICPYPPGIPVLLPGEVVTPAAIAYLHQVLAIGGVISGCADPSLQTLQVVQGSGAGY